MSGSTHATISNNDMVEHLLLAVMAAGGVRAFARAHDLGSHGPLSQMLNHQREVSEAVANCLGFIKRTSFERIIL